MRVRARARVRVILSLSSGHQLALLLEQLRHVVVEGVVLHHVHAGEARHARHLIGKGTGRVREGCGKGAGRVREGCVKGAGRVREGKGGEK